MSDVEDSAELPEQLQVRRAKYDRLLAAGRDPYPAGFERSSTAAQLREQFAGLAPDVSTGQEVSVGGRVVLSRIGGGLCFATLRDGSGDIQVMVSRAGVGEGALEDWKRDVDLGDQVGIAGEVITSRRGELSVLARSWTLTAKALRPLPEKFRGLSDPEARVRQRYVDLIVRPEARAMLEWRAALLWQLRGSLHDRRFVEVETPMLQPVHGGATARPFVTHHNALGLPLYLRIAPELYLKRLLVGGVERVCEINRNFRNEGMDATHNPEFTMLEAYQAYGDYDTVATLTEELVKEAAQCLEGLGAEPPGHLGEPWRSATLHDLVSAALGEPVDQATPLEVLRGHARAAGVELDPSWTAGAVVLELYEKLVEHTLKSPTFVRDFPVDVSPLTRRHRRHDALAERWDLVAGGMELATGYTELTDPVEQRRRLSEQSLRAAGGDPEAMVVDEDFLAALETGMPPAGGMGMGIDRLLMLLTGANSIRETTLFPLVRPREK